jgi:hypothetical protein
VNPRDYWHGRHYAGNKAFAFIGIVVVIGAIVWWLTSL